MQDTFIFEKIIESRLRVKLSNQLRKWVSILKSNRSHFIYINGDLVASILLTSYVGLTYNPWCHTLNFIFNSFLVFKIANCPSLLLDSKICCMIDFIFLCRHLQTINLLISVLVHCSILRFIFRGMMMNQTVRRSWKGNLNLTRSVQSLIFFIISVLLGYSSLNQYCFWFYLGPI